MTLESGLHIGMLGPPTYIPTVQPHWIHFARAITRPWVGQLGSLWYILVEEGLQFFLRYSGPISVNGKVFKNQVENWKIAFWAFFVWLSKTKISIMKCSFLFYFLTMGWRGIDTDTIEHNGLGILGKTQTFEDKKVWHCDSCHNVTTPIITFFQFSGITNQTYYCDKCHTLTLSDW